MISEKQDVQSQFVIYLSIKEDKDKGKVEEIKKRLIESKVKNFFDNRNPPVSKYKKISVAKEISDLDFQAKNFDDFFTHFYKHIVDDIYKKPDGKIEIPVTYCITLDKECCQKTCEETGILYDEILLYNQPVFYFIYVDIEEVFTYLRKQSNSFSL